MKTKPKRSAHRRGKADSPIPKRRRVTQDPMQVTPRQETRINGLEFRRLF